MRNVFTAFRDSSRRLTTRADDDSPLFFLASLPPFPLHTSSPTRWSAASEPFHVHLVGAYGVRVGAAWARRLLRCMRQQSGMYRCRCHSCLESVHVGPQLIKVRGSRPLTPGTLAFK